MYVTRGNLPYLLYFREVYFSLCRSYRANLYKCAQCVGFVLVNNLFQMITHPSVDNLMINNVVVCIIYLVSNVGPSFSE